MLFKKKETIKKEKYDKENLTPQIHASICTGEQVIGFLDKRDGKFTEIMLVHDYSDIEKFRKIYDIDCEIKKVY